MAEQPATNLGNPETRVSLAIGWFVSTMALMVTFAAGRFYARSAIKGGLKVDDWVMALAVVFAIPVSVLGCIATNFGLGYHVGDIKPQWTVPRAKIAVGTDAIIPLAMSLTKASICLGYVRLFPTHANRVFCYVATTYVLCWGIGVSISLIFSCVPIQSHWDHTITDKTCINFRDAIFASASLNIFSDFIVFLWPAHILWKVRVSRKRRFGLILLFAVGCIVCAAGAARIYTFQYFFTSNDHDYNAAILWPVTATEVDLSIMCGCLPALKPLLIRLFPSFSDAPHGDSNIIFGSQNPFHWNTPSPSLDCEAQKKVASGKGYATVSKRSGPSEEDIIALNKIVTDNTEARGESDGRSLR